MFPVPLPVAGRLRVIGLLEPPEIMVSSGSPRLEVTHAFVVPIDTEILQHCTQRLFGFADEMLELYLPYCDAGTLPVRNDIVVNTMTACKILEVRRKIIAARMRLKEVCKTGVARIAPAMEDAGGGKQRRNESGWFRA